MRAIWLLSLLLLTGCLATNRQMSIDAGQIDVFGVSLHSATDYREIMGVRGSDEPCLKGYERTFDALDIVIGYGRDGKVRKITSRNTQNSIFGIRPGDSLETALEKIHGAGFTLNGLPYRFRKEGLILTLLADGTGRLFGLTLELAS